MEHWFNERLLFPLVLFIIWVVRTFKAARDKAAAARDGRPVARGPHGEPIDPEAEERQRRVREEVARKIAERKALAERKILMMPSASLERRPRPPAVEATEVRDDPQPANAAPNWGLSADRSSAPAALRQGFGGQGGRDAPDPWDGPPARPPSAVPSSAAVPVLTARQTALAEDFERWSAASGRPVAAAALDHLRDPAELRRAMLLREILGPPVGLRR